MDHAIMTISFSLCLFGVGLLLVCPISILDGAALLGSQKCPRGYFFDDVLQKCENCYAVCIDAVLQRTEDKCALCEDRIPPNPEADSHASSPETTSILVVGLVLGIIGFIVIVIVIAAIIKRRPLHRMCQRLQARLSLQDIRGQDDTAEDRLHAAAMLIAVSPNHDPQNTIDYPKQKEFDLKLARSGQKNVPTGSFAAHHSEQITSLVHEELLVNDKMGSAGIDVHETLLKS
ncbi:hypothetical protein ACJMK2_033688 [Sinanodonta woodiana]|uniref:Uncharacterized protein n=1 Tax=Sinanodonta woodiana TaxID=1069815 RepID=A0ABD3WTD0_SINWO